MQDLSSGHPRVKPEHDDRDRPRNVASDATRPCARRAERAIAVAQGSCHLPAMPHPKPTRINFYAGVPLDRADHLRGDAERLAELLGGPRVRVVPLWRSLHLVAGEADAVWLERTEIGEILDKGGEAIFLGLREETAYLALDLSHLDEPAVEPLGGAAAAFRDLRQVGPIMNREESAILAYARGLAHWHARHGFCGVCGSATISEKGGHQRRCSNADCNTVHFPRTDPCVIMLITDGDRALLGRPPRLAEGVFTTLAGFMEPGETIEQAVRRETFEEAGIEVGDVRLLSNQPWPFPANLMLGCLGDALSSEISIGDDELEACRWCDRTEVRQMVDGTHPLGHRIPPAISIAHELIIGWLEDVK